MELKSFFAQDLQGNVIPLPVVHVYEPGTATHVDGLADRDNAPLANPFTGASSGRVSFRAPTGLYDIRIVGGGRDYTIEEVQFIDRMDLAVSPDDNWTLNTYTNSAWTDLVAVPAVISTVTIANTAGAAVNVEMRLEDAGTGLATLLPTASIAAGTSQSFESRAIVVKGTQALQVRADAAGINFTATGAAL